MMKKSFALLPLIMVVVFSTTEVFASSVGGGIYVPIKAIHSSDDCPTGHCRSGATCSHCARLGFACVDGATDAPCTANGGCYPKRPTFGHYAQKWRTWPGEPADPSQNPELAEEDSLLKSYDPPVAEEEDQQAPPSIEESVDIEAEDIPSAVPSVEIELPPLPQVAPGRQRQPVQQQQAPNNFRQPVGAPRGGMPNGPQPNGSQRPPAPPFGLIAPEKNNEPKLPEVTTNDLVSSRSNFATPAGYVPSAQGPSSVATGKQKVNKRVENPAVKSNRPPALPVGLTRSTPNLESTPALRRLPVSPTYRRDTSIQPTAAFE